MPWSTPIFFYGNVVWANAYQSHLEKIYKLQKKLVRIITFKEYNHSSKPLFDNLKLLNFIKLIITLEEKTFSPDQLPVLHSIKNQKKITQVSDQNKRREIKH